MDEEIIPSGNLTRSLKPSPLCMIGHCMPKNEPTFAWSWPSWSSRPRTVLIWNGGYLQLRIQSWKLLLVFAPARGVPESVIQRAQEQARGAVAVFWGKCVFGVEMFWQENGKSSDPVFDTHTDHIDDLLINENALRPVRLFNVRLVSVLSVSDCDYTIPRSRAASGTLVPHRDAREMHPALTDG